MDNVLSFLNHGWVGTLLGLLGLVFGIYQIRRRTGARLTYQDFGQRLIEGGGGVLPSEVAVVYEGRQVPRVSLTQIVIWNAGHAPVHGQDVIADDPVRFSFGRDCEILKIDVDKCTRKANASVVSVDDQDRSTFRYIFSFLDRDDGALIRVLHTGTRIRPTCHGTIVGVPRGVEWVGRIPDASNRWPVRSSAKQPAFICFLANMMRRHGYSLLLIPVILGVGIMVLGLWPDAMSDFGLILNPRRQYRVVAIGFIISTFCGVIFLMERRRFPVSLIPDELANNHNDGKN